MAQYNDVGQNVLPADFDGDFYFSNPDDEEFIGKWGGKAYRYAPQTRSKMIISKASPEEVQQIRKKFARELGNKMFFKSEKAKQMTTIERQSNGEPVFRSIHQANTYSDADIAPYTQACLDPLPLARASVSEAVKEDIVEKLHRDEDGDLVTLAVKERQSLTDKVFKDNPTG